MIGAKSVFATRHGLVIAAAVIVAACQTTTIKAPAVQPGDAGTDAVNQTNVWFENFEKEAPTPNSPLIKLQNQIWRDKPQYQALAGAKHLKEVRMRYAALAKCPGGLGPVEVDAKVDVSFVVGLDGRVEDARVIWSSDEGFNQAALDAIRQDVFIPALGPTGAERAMYVMPYHFTKTGSWGGPKKPFPKIDPKNPPHIGEAYYPTESVRLHEKGTCKVSVTVTADGKIQNIKLTESSGYPRLDKACLDAFADGGLLPATVDGKPIDMTVELPISWLP
jgi:TonB family protein